MLKKWIVFCAVFIISSMLPASFALAATAADYNDYTDIWCVDTGCNGSGINLVQNNNTIFASFYIYDTYGAPTWTSSDLHRKESNKGAFTGKLYSARSGPTSSPFNPSAVELMEIGTVTLTPAGINEVALEYTAYGVTTARTINRFGLEPLLIGGTYWGSAIVEEKSCSPSSANRSASTSFVLSVEQKSGSTQGTFALSMDNDVTCTLKGTLQQEGRFARINNASYVCKQGSTQILDTTAQISKIAVTMQGIEGEWTANVANRCKESARFSAVSY